MCNYTSFSKNNFPFSSSPSSASHPSPSYSHCHVWLTHPQRSGLPETCRADLPLTNPTTRGSGATGDPRPRQPCSVTCSRRTSGRGRAERLPLPLPGSSDRAVPLQVLLSQVNPCHLKGNPYRPRENPCHLKESPCHLRVNPCSTRARNPCPTSLSAPRASSSHRREACPSQRSPTAVRPRETRSSDPGLQAPSRRDRPSPCPTGDAPRPPSGASRRDLHAGAQ